MYLIPRFAGNKGNERKYRLWDGGVYGCSCEPFAGSGAFSQRQLRRGSRLAIYSDRSPILLPIYEVWLDKSLHSGFYEHFQKWQKLLLEIFDKGEPFWELQPPKKGDKKPKYKVVLKHREGMDEVWAYLEEPLNKALKGQPVDPVEVAAASQVYRYSNYGAIVRTSPGSGELNVSWNGGRVHQQLRRWKYRLPPVPKGSEVLLFDDCFKAIDELRNWAELHPTEKAICLDDPPYWVPQPDPNDPAMAEIFAKRKTKTTMSAAYEDHDPHADFTLTLTTKTLEGLYQIPNLTRLVVANYWSPELDKAIREVSPNCKVQILKKLNNINRYCESRTENIEALWEFGSLHYQQLDIFSSLNAA